MCQNLQLIETNNVLFISDDERFLDPQHTKEILTRHLKETKGGRLEWGVRGVGVGEENQKSFVKVFR